MSSKISVGIVGGGLLGLATAYALQRMKPRTLVRVYEKEDSICLHQSGNNSGVLHCGLYYLPGSLKAHLAVCGIREMISFCEEHQISHEVCGKVVVASNETESERLLDLAARGKANGLHGLSLLSTKELKEKEPYVQAHSSLFVPEEGIADFRAVGRKLSELIQVDEGEIFSATYALSCSVHSESELVLHTNKGDFSHNYIIFCAGLHSDRLYTTSSNVKSDTKIIPFRGEYYSLAGEGAGLLNHLVYPVPDPQFPFLGVHFTRMITGEKEVGPNAVLAFKREGYQLSDFSPGDVFESLSYPGLIRFLGKNFKFSMGEFATSLSKEKFLSKAKKLIPDIELKHLKKGNTGVRAQTMSKSGELVMDFLIKREGRQVHVLNAPSPGATASLVIGKHIVENYVFQ